MEAKAPVGSVSLEATIRRSDGTVEDLGTIAFWHKSRLKRWLWKIRH